MPAFQRWREVERMASWWAFGVTSYVAAGNDIASNNTLSKNT